MNRKQFPLAARLLTAAAALCWLTLATAPTLAQGLAPFDRDNARAMLDAVRDDLRKNYYDPSLRGMDVEARFRAAEERLKAAQTRDQLVVTVAQVLMELNDSHTFLLPPPRAARVEYGWRMKMYGDGCYVSAVRPKSHAETAGLKVGDRILAVDGFRPTRENMWKMYYRYYALAPARAVRLSVQSPGADAPREVEVNTKIEKAAAVSEWRDIFVRALREEWDIDHDRFFESGTDLLVWQMPTFEVSPDHVDDIMARARNYKTLVLDLRGNGGGYQVALERLVGHLFERDLKIADLRGRKEMKPILAKTRGAGGFKGQLVVLVDADSGSASELLARVVQLEKRGTVLGDRSAGAVMVSKHFDHQTGVGSVLYFGASVTVADVVMADGKSLEGAGVIPDEPLLPTGADLAARRDPVLARAAALAGVKLDPEKAGALFPIQWRK
ncbi:MAG TPA: S41 family peptidase [Pyrinomonadaceae bacterium]